MKLFIPTCTLNFNNIFSTESISPKAFYQRRGFGNKRFYPVEANSLDVVVLLYSKYPRYNVEDSELENYPMVIEIESDDYPAGIITKQNTHSGVEVYVSASTIYLNPFHTKIYFNSYAERQGVLTKAAQSLENKFEKLYGANLVVKPQTKRGFFDNAKYLFSKNDCDEFEWDSSYLPTEIDADISNIELDRKIDRIRGFVYCYLIGANMTVSSDVAELKLLARRMRNTLSAIVNSPTHTPSDLQDDSLTKDIIEFNRIYSSIDEDALYNANIIDMRLSSNPLKLEKQDVVNLLEWLEIYADFCSKLHLRRIYNANDLWKCVEFYSPESYNNAIDTLSSVVRKVELKSICKGKKNEIKELVRIGNDGSVNVLDKTVKPEFYDSLLNSQIGNEYEAVKNENGIDEPLAIAYNGGKILQRILGDKWNDSKWAKYINALLSHLQESSAFDLYSIDNDVLNSFAAFCQKGDNIDRLSEYLVQCGFNNYRLAFGLYGATRGFASLPKTFTSTLINGDRDYYKSFVLNVYQQLFGVSISNAEFPTQSNPFEIRESSIGNTIMRNIGKIETKPSKQTQDINAVSQALELEDAVQSPKVFMYIADNILGKGTKVYKALKAANFEKDNTKYSEDGFKERIYSIIESALPKAKAQRQETIEKINRLIELEAKRQDAEAFLYILNDLLKPSDEAYKRIMSILTTSRSSGYQQSPQIAPRSNQAQKPINKTSNLFVEDANVTNFILTCTYLPRETRSLLSEKVILFQKDYSPGGYYYGREDNPRTNDNTIKHFVNKCTYQKGKSSSWLPATQENKQLLERLRTDLVNRYENIL
ncbi:MAG: hypothetical protein IKH59_07615 [Bacteroidaceae bacterium]|nr:hypothetical protein [Bacteroidaceae bacterium]